MSHRMIIVEEKATVSKTDADRTKSQQRKIVIQEKDPQIQVGESALIKSASRTGPDCNDGLSPLGQHPDSMLSTPKKMNVNLTDHINETIDEENQQEKERQTNAIKHTRLSRE